MIINDLDGYYIVFDTKNWNTELDTLTIKSHSPDYKELFPIEIYSQPPTRKERRKRERELKKKLPIDFTKFIKLHRT